MLFISILGDFHSSIFPLYNEFKNKISYHILVNDDAFAQRQKNKQVQKSLAIFNETKNLHIPTEFFLIDEDSYESIEKLVLHLKKIEPDMSKIYINITDGLASIGINLAAKLLNKGTNFLSYDMYENSYNITNKYGMQTYNLKNCLSIQEHFQLKGLQVQTNEDKKFAHKYQRQILELFNNYEVQMQILNKDIAKQTTQNKNKYPVALQIIKSMHLDLLKDAVIISGKLFEYYIYLLIKDLGFNDIEIGLVVKQFLNDEIGIMNEFDILLMKDNHLHMIECKFRKNISKQELVYKYASLNNLIDDEGKIMIVTNDSPYYHDIFNKKNTTLANHRRAFLNRIALRGSVIHNKARFLDEVQTLFL